METVNPERTPALDLTPAEYAILRCALDLYLHGANEDVRRLRHGGPVKSALLAAATASRDRIAALCDKVCPLPEWAHEHVVTIESVCAAARAAYDY